MGEALEWTHDPLRGPPLSRCAHAGLYAPEVARRTTHRLSLPIAWEARSRKLSLSRLFEGMDDPGLFVDCVFAFRTRLPHFLAYRAGTMRLSEVRM